MVSIIMPIVPAYYISRQLGIALVVPGTVCTTLASIMQWETFSRNYYSQTSAPVDIASMVGNYVIGAIWPNTGAPVRQHANSTDQANVVGIIIAALIVNGRPDPSIAHTRTWDTPSALLVDALRHRS